MSKDKSPNYLQDMINKKLREIVKTEAFKRDVINLKVANRPYMECKRSHSHNIYCETKQIRSADEPETEIFTCLDCGKRWRRD